MSSARCRLSSGRSPQPIAGTVVMRLTGERPHRLGASRREVLNRVGIWLVGQRVLVELAALGPAQHGDKHIGASSKVVFVNEANRDTRRCRMPS
jgi:hypothetical protein